MIDSNSILAFLQSWWVEVLSGVVIATTFPFIAAHYVHAEHKFVQQLQGNPSQRTAGQESLTQPLNEFAEFFLSEATVPENTDKLLFWLAPLLSYAAAFIAIGALAVGPAFQAARDINIGLLFAIGVSSLGILGIMLGACASPNTTAILAAMRSSVQLVSCQTAAAFALVSGALLAGSLKIRAIVAVQQQQSAWFVFLAPIAFALYVVATLAETNRGRDGIQQGHGNPRTLYSLAEFANRVVNPGLATTVFLGGWLRPFPNVHWLNALDFVPPLLMMLAAVRCVRRAGRQGSRSGLIFMYNKAFACLVAAVLLAGPLLITSLRFLQPAAHGAFWFLVKLIAFLFFFTSVRFTLPRHRFENVMRFAWRFLIPLTIANTFFVAIALLLESEYRWNQWLATLLTTVTILAVARVLWYWHEKRVTPVTSSLAPAIAPDSHGG